MSLSDGLPDYEPTEEEWAELMAAYDEWGGLFPPEDEPPQIDDSAYFDAADLAELFEPSDSDEDWRREHAT